MCKKGTEIAAMNYGGELTQVLKYEKIMENTQYDDDFIFDEYYYVGACQISYYDMLVDINPDKFDEILIRINNLIVFS